MAETEEDWQELFDTYRYEVISAGFGAWDEAAFANNDPADGPSDPDRLYRSDRPLWMPGEPDDVSARFELYANRFVYMLKALDSCTIDGLLTDLGERITTQDGRAVSTALIRMDDGEVEQLGTRYRHEGLVEAFQELNETLFAPEDPQPLGTLVIA